MTYFCFIKYKNLSNWTLLFQLSIEELQQAKPANNAVTSVAPAQQPAADNDNSNDNGGSDNNNSSDNGSSVRTNVKPCFWILNKVRIT